MYSNGKIGGIALIVTSSIMKKSKSKRFFAGYKCRGLSGMTALQFLPYIHHLNML